MSHCLLECNNVRKPFSLLYLGVFRIMDNMDLLWIYISYLCLKRNTSFNSINIIKVISIINRVISISNRSMVVRRFCIVSCLYRRYRHIQSLIINTNVLFFIVKHVRFSFWLKFRL
jgi:hypothetical protein